MNGDLKTPEWMDSLIDNLAPDDLVEEISGDLYELFVVDVSKRGLRTAKTKYVFNGLGFLLKSFFWKKSTHSHPNILIMLSSYFKMATRSLRAYKGTAAINILGLVIGIASALVILTVIRFELSFDTFHSNADRIYRLVRVSGADMSEFRTGVSYPVPVALKDELTSAESIVSVEYFGGGNVDILDKSGNSIRKFREENGCAIVESSFFKVFDFNGTGFKWISGNPDKALDGPFNVVLTKSIAKKYYGDEDPIGRTIKFQRTFDCKVTGVVDDLPANTDFPITIFVSYETLHTLAGDELKNWTSVNDSHHTYLVLPEGTSESEIEKQIAKIHAAHTNKELSDHRHYLLQKLSDLHFDPKFGTFTGRTITRDTVLALGIIAAFLLLTGSINYINLSTAQSTMRAKEIGLRKVMGSDRKNLVFQFMTETFLIVMTSGFLGLGLAEVLLFNFQDLLNLKLTDYNFLDPFVLLSLLTIVIVVTFFAGLYPSISISRFSPIASLKNAFSTEKFGGFSLRKALVVVQFTITQILVVGTFIVVSQMNYFQNVDMGFNKEAIISVRIPESENAAGRNRTLGDALRSQSFIAGHSFSYTLPSGVNRNRSYSDIGREDAAEMKDFQIYEYVAIDPAFLDLYQIRILAGRNLTEQDSQRYILINNTLAKNLQWKRPEEAVGKQAKMNGNLVTIAGVVDDYHSNSLKEGVDNIAMIMNPGAYSTVSIKLNVKDGAGTLPEAVEKVGKIWSASYPEFVFTYQFLDENIKAFYEQERKYAQLFQLFSLIFLSIGCLGLYGLITFVVNRKGREVAIRKVLGATISQILVMFSKEYIQLIVLSFVIAVPVAYYLVNSWLSNFANHIELKWWLFVIPGVSVLALALIVVITKSLKTANANPVDKLKYE